MATAAAPDYYDEKWKLSKKESRSAGAASSSSSFVRSCSTSSTAFMRSCSSSSPTFIRSSSTASSATRGSRSSFSRKCASLVKEQRAKFYIVRRCVTMLVCWKDYRDS